MAALAGFWEGWSWEQMDVAVTRCHPCAAGEPPCPREDTSGHEVASSAWQSSSVSYT